MPAIIQHGNPHLSTQATAKENGTVRPPLSRSNSKPSSLRIRQGDWTPDIELDHTPVPNQNGNSLLPSQVTESDGLTSTPPNNYTASPMKSPCFVHSNLDNGASLTNWLLSKQQPAGFDPGTLGVAKSLRNHSDRSGATMDGKDNVLGPLDAPEDEDDYAGNLTRQLAETAVGVREMSKQLGSCLCD
jgi:NAD+ kinase